MSLHTRQGIIYPPTVPVLDGSDPINRGLMAWWRFEPNDKAGTSILDATGNRYTGTLVGTPPFIKGRVGQALSLNGSSQYMSGTDAFPTGTSVLTISFWFYYTASSAFGNLISKNPNSNNSTTWDWGLLWDSPPNDLYLIRNGANLSPTGVNLTTSVWMHIAAVIGVSASYFYVNGLLKNTQGGVGAGATSNTSGRFIQIGGAGGGFTGSIDEVRIHNRALTSSEISRLYSDTSGGLGLVKPRKVFGRGSGAPIWHPRVIRWGR